jgi:hypothetical protein
MITKISRSVKSNYCQQMLFKKILCTKFRHTKVSNIDPSTSRYALSQNTTLKKFQLTDWEKSHF